MQMKRLYILLFVLLANISSAQDSYKQMNLQGQLIGRGEGTTSLECMILDELGDTLWRASYGSVPIHESGMFRLDIGSGDYISGTYPSFEMIAWMNAIRFELYELDPDRRLIGVYGISIVPYSFHAKSVDSAPLLFDLNDTPEDTAEEGDVFRFDGFYFLWSNDSLYTNPYAELADSISYADTVWFAFNDEFADSSSFSLYTDTADYAYSMFESDYGDTARYADSAGRGFYSMGNWGIFGNNSTVDTNFIGTTTADSLIFRTNNVSRFIISDSSVRNGIEGKGFRWETNKGYLVTPNDSIGPTEFGGAHLYFNGDRSLLHAGRSDESIDTLMGQYSFAFGENVGTNGTYSTVFGKDTYGDTAIFAATTPYAAISSFALGRNCHVTHMGVAIGDSAIAGYYRNIAIGHRAIATTASAGTAIGDNLLVTGATSWAAGHNLTGTGNFSTVLGTNASTNGHTGAFVYGDASTADTVMNTAAHQFMIRAAGGYVFYSNVGLTMGVELLPGAGSWSMISDRNKKMNILALEPAIYRPVFDSLTIYNWNYLGGMTSHIGPMAQDVYGLFHIGEKPYLINMIDSDGVTMLGIQMLRGALEEIKLLDQNTVEEEIEKERDALDEMEQRINILYEELDNR